MKEKKIYKFFIVAAFLMSQEGYAQQINSNRSDIHFSREAYGVEDGLDGYRGLGIEYKSMIYLGYDHVANPVVTTRSGGEDKLFDVVEKFQRVRIGGGMFVTPSLFLALSLPLDFVRARSPFSTSGENPTLGLLDFENSGLILGDIDLRAKFRLFNLRDRWNWTLTSKVTAPTGKKKWFNTDTSFSASLGLAFTRYLGSSFRWRSYGNIGFRYAPDSFVVLDSKYRKIDTSKLLSGGLGISYRVHRKIPLQVFTEISGSINLPYEDSQNPFSLSIGANYHFKKRYTAYLGYGLEEFFDPTNHQERRFFLGVKKMLGTGTDLSKIKRTQKRQKLRHSQEGYIVDNYRQHYKKQGKEVPQARSLKESLYLARRIHFQTGRAKILPISYPILNSAVSYILAAQDRIKSIVIEGHSDTRGSEESNQVLSVARANSVKKFFVKRGVKSSILKIKGKGEEKPLVEEVDADSLRINRRVEFYLKEFE